MPEIKRYLCAICKEEEIIQGRDVSKDRKNYTIEGGKLFLKRPRVKWKLPLKTVMDTMNVSTKPPIGGICDECLKK